MYTKREKANVASTHVVYISRLLKDVYCTTFSFSEHLTSAAPCVVLYTENNGTRLILVLKQKTITFVNYQLFM
jgi:hypothetical protein